jgi:hypothetical protein
MLWFADWKKSQSRSCIFELASRMADSELHRRHDGEPISHHSVQVTTTAPILEQYYDFSTDLPEPWKTHNIAPSAGNLSRSRFLNLGTVAT